MKFSCNEHRSGICDKNLSRSPLLTSELPDILAAAKEQRKTRRNIIFLILAANNRLSKPSVSFPSSKKCCSLEKKVFRDDKKHLVRNKLCVKENELERETKPGRIDVLNL